MREKPRQKELTMTSIRNFKYATASTIGSFVVAAISGLLIFFEVEVGGIRPTHEWGSILFVLCGCWHIYSHKKPFITYFKNKTLLISMSSTLAIGLIIFTISFNDIYIASEIQLRVEKGPLTNLTHTLGIKQETLSKALKNKGVLSFKNTDSLKSLAHEYNFETHEVFEELFRIENKEIYNEKI